MLTVPHVKIPLVMYKRVMKEKNSSSLFAIVKMSSTPPPPPPPLKKKRSGSDFFSRDDLTKYLDKNFFEDVGRERGNNY
jgi:hypothetical protein